MIYSAIFLLLDDFWFIALVLPLVYDILCELKVSVCPINDTIIITNYEARWIVFKNVVST